MFELTDKVALVTGGGSGIGAAIAELFSARGANVQLLEIDGERGAATAARIRDSGGKATLRSCDVAEQSAVVDAVGAIVEQLGRVDILVNNAGIAHVGRAADTSEADFDRVYAVNVKGVYNGCKAALEPMLEQGGGVILNLASIASVIGIKDRFAYSMSKGAVLTMTLSVAIDYVDQGIRCNCICPARIHTPFVDGFIRDNYPGREQEIFGALSRYQPVGRMGRPDEVAALALYLCSDEAAFITGAAYPIDGGVIGVR